MSLALMVILCVTADCIPFLLQRSAVLESSSLSIGKKNGTLGDLWYLWTLILFGDSISGVQIS